MKLNFIKFSLTLLSTKNFLSKKKLSYHIPLKSKYKIEYIYKQPTRIRIFSICFSTFLERRKGGVSNRRTECVGKRRHVSAWAIEPWETLISSFVSYWKTFIAP